MFKYYIKKGKSSSKTVKNKCKTFYGSFKEVSFQIKKCQVYQFNQTDPKKKDFPKKSTWQKFYNKDIEKENTFDETFLGYTGTL